MIAMLFLVGALSLAALGALAVWIASRPRRERFGSTIDTFSRDLDALAPPGQNRQPPPAGRQPSHRGASSPTAHRRTAAAAPAQARPKPGPRPTGRGPAT